MQSVKLWIMQSDTESNDKIEKDCYDNLHRHINAYTHYQNTTNIIKNEHDTLNSSIDPIINSIPTNIYTYLRYTS